MTSWLDGQLGFVGTLRKLLGNGQGYKKDVLPSGHADQGVCI